MVKIGQDCLKRIAKKFNLKHIKSVCLKTPKEVVNNVIRLRNHLSLLCEIPSFTQYFIHMFEFKVRKNDTGKITTNSVT